MADYGSQRKLLCSRVSASDLFRAGCRLSNLGGRRAFYPAVKKLSTAATARDTSSPVALRATRMASARRPFASKGLRLNRPWLRALSVFVDALIARSRAGVWPA